MGSNPIFSKKMYIALIFLSFIGACLAGLFGRQVGAWGAATITTGCLFFSLVLSLFAFYEVALSGGFVYIKLATWVNSEVLNIDWGFMFDSLTVVMCVVVTFISSFVHLYSMIEDIGDIKRHWVITCMYCT